jgi:hypothetical protein
MTAELRLPGACQGKLVRYLLHCWLMIALGVILAAAVVQDYRLLQTYTYLKARILVAEIVAGAGVAFCFGGAMHYLDLALAYRRATGERLAWYWRLLLVVQKRVLVLVQLAGAAVVVTVLGIVIFDWKIPGVAR